MSTLAQQVALEASGKGSQLGTSGPPDTPTCIHKHPNEPENTHTRSSDHIRAFCGVSGGLGGSGAQDVLDDHMAQSWSYPHMITYWAPKHQKPTQTPHKVRIWLEQRVWVFSSAFGCLCLCCRSWGWPDVPYWELVPDALGANCCAKVLIMYPPSRWHQKSIPTRIWTHSSEICLI